jgi:SAM-dependent methyltransferase
VRQVWTAVYESKGPGQRSWTQQSPDESVRLIEAHGAGPEGSVVDVGGGASSLALALLDRGYRDVTVVDIAPPALSELRAASTTRGHQTTRLTTVVNDVLEFDPPKRFAIWHDRAVFHFLVEPIQLARYRERLTSLLEPGGLAIIATFSPDGPTACSGLPVQRWSTNSLAEFFAPEFESIESFTSDHVTPTGSTQPFSWVALRLSNTAITQ